MPAFPDQKSRQTVYENANADKKHSVSDHKQLPRTMSSKTHNLPSISNEKPHSQFSKQTCSHSDSPNTNFDFPQVPLLSSGSGSTQVDTDHFLDVAVGQIQSQALVDSGAVISCASSSFVSSLDTALLKWSEPTFKRAVGVGGEQHKIDSCVTFSFQLGASTFTHTFHVLPGHHPMILGLDWLKQTGAQVQFGKQSCITVHNMHLPLVSRSFSVATKETTHIPARSVCFISVDLPPNIPLHRPIYIEGKDLVHVHPSVHVTPAVDEYTATGQGKCRLVNSSNSPVTIPKGFTLASAQPIHPDDLCSFQLPQQVASTATSQGDNEEDPNVLKDNIEFHISQALTPAQKKEMLQLLVDNRKVFSTCTAELGQTDLIEHSIDTGDAKPVNQRSYRVSPKHRQDLDDIIDDMLKHGLIEHSTSKWSSPCLLVDKQDGTKRLVVDFRRVNKVCIPATYPMPTLEAIWEAIGECKPLYFSTMDLWSGFHQIPLSPESKEKTAFSTMDRHLQYCVMPMGLAGSPITFQQLMVNVLRDLQFKCTVVYADDIICYSSNFSDHLKNLQMVFDRLAKAKLTLKPSKCQFGVSTVKYLGHILSSTGVTPNPEKTAIIDRFPKPKTVKHIRRFTGLTNYYRRFIPNYSAIVSPLTNLLKKDTKFVWSSDCEKAFQTLKTLLVSEPVLRYPDHSKHFYLTTDASTHGISYILGQKDDTGGHYVCYYGARSLKPNEKNYGITDLEALAVVTGVEKYHTYLIDKPFTIITDHEALKHMVQAKFQGTSGKLARWAQILMPFQYTVQYLPGRKNSSADCLSRIQHIVDPAAPLSSLSIQDLPKLSPTDNSNSKHVTGVLQYHLEWNTNCAKLPIIQSPLQVPPLPTLCPTDTAPSPEVISDTDVVPDKTEVHFKNLPQAQQQCAEIGPRYRYHAQGTLPSDQALNKRIVAEKDCYTVLENILYHLPRPSKLNPVPHRQVVVPSHYRHSLLQEFHDSIMAGGHQGFDRTYCSLKQYYYWPNMYKDTYEYVRGCLPCQTSKRAYHSHPPPLKPLPVAEVFERLHIDYLGPLTKTAEGYTNILVVVDSSSKWVEAFPTYTQTAKETAKILYREILTRYGAPRVLVSDRGKSFMNSLIQGLCELFSVKLARTSPYKPSTNAPAERINGFLLASLRSYCKPDHSNWPDILPGILMAHRATPATQSTGYSPYYLLFGKDMQRPIDVALRPKDSLPENTRECLDTFVENLKVTRAIAANNQQQQLEKNKVHFDKKAKQPDFKVGDLVKMKNHQKVVGRCPKLDPGWLHQFIIAEEGPNFTYKLRNTMTQKQTDFINARHIEPLHTQPTFPAAPDDLQSSQEQSTAGSQANPSQNTPDLPTAPVPNDPAPNQGPSDVNFELHPIVAIKRASYYKGEKWYKVKRHNLKGLYDVRSDLIPEALRSHFHANYNFQGKKKKKPVTQFVHTNNTA